MGVALSEEALKQILSLLKSIQEDVLDLKTRVDSLESRETQVSDQSPILHTLRRIDQIKAEEQLRKRKRIEEILSEAAIYAIADFKQNPPKHRR
jgi:hypothetical protein